MTEEKPYREGDDPETEPASAPEVGVQVTKVTVAGDGDAEPEEGTPEEPVDAPEGEEGDEPAEAVPVTAFLVVVHDAGRVDAVVGLPRDVFPRQRDATLRDVRDASVGLAMDSIVTMVVGGTSEAVGKSMAKAAEAHMVQRMRQQMTGAGKVRPTPGVGKS